VSVRADVESHKLIEKTYTMQASYTWFDRAVTGPQCANSRRARLRSPAAVTTRRRRDVDSAVPETNYLPIGDGELRKVGIERLWARSQRKADTLIDLWTCEVAAR
jgi:hypothetical protein